MFYDNFERICKERGTTPSATVLKIGRSKNAAGNWKKNGTIPKEDELEELSKVLNCRVADFFKEEQLEYSVVCYPGAAERNASADKLLDAIDNGFVIDDNVVDLIRIYSNCATARQRTQFMSAVYDFEDKVLNAEQDPC